MDARVCARPGCGNPLLPGRKLKDVCTYACRGQFKALKLPWCQPGLRALKTSSRTRRYRA